MTIVFACISDSREENLTELEVYNRVTKRGAIVGLRVWDNAWEGQSVNISMNLNLENWNSLVKGLLKAGKTNNWKLEPFEINGEEYGVYSKREIK